MYGGSPPLEKALKMSRFAYTAGDVHSKQLHRAFCEAGGKDIGAYDFRPRDDRWFLTVSKADAAVVRRVLAGLPEWEEREVKNRFG